MFHRKDARLTISLYDGNTNAVIKITDLTGVVDGDNVIIENVELKQGKIMLSSAALTYVASVANTLLQILRLILLYGRRDD